MGVLRREEGMTLVELLVVMVISGVVLSMVGTALIQSQRTVAGTFQRQADLGEARIAAAAATADLRTLTPLGDTYLESATGRQVTFFARRDEAIDDPPVRIRLRLEDNGDLVSSSTRLTDQSNPTPPPADYDDPALATTQQRVLASGLALDEPVFRYYSSYALVTDGSSEGVTADPMELAMVTPSGGGDPEVPVADRSSVRFIEVRLLVDQGGSQDVTATSVRQLVRLPNA